MTIGDPWAIGSGDRHIVLAGAPTGYAKKVRQAMGRSASLVVSTWKGDLEDEDTAAKIAALQPAVVALGPAIKRADAVRLAAEFEEFDAGIAVVLVAKPDAATMQDAMVVGIRGVIAPGAKSSEIKTTYQRALSSAERRKDLRVKPSAVVARKRIITVISAKGGTGKTVTSSNLAVTLAHHAPKDVCLVDLDLQFGDVATALLLSPIHTMKDAAVAAHRGLDAATLKVFLARHAPTDLFVLCAAEDPVDAETITGSDVTRILGLLTDQFRFVVIDTDPGLGETTLAALEASTDIVVVVDLDVPAVRGTHKVLKALDAIGMTKARRHVVLNRANSKVSLSLAEVEDAIGVDIDLALPSTRRVPMSLNQGQPITLSHPRARFSRKFGLLASRFGSEMSKKPGGEVQS